jgi:hypothetical protein
MQFIKHGFTKCAALSGMFIILLLGSVTISTSQEPWITKAPMPTSRLWFSCEVVDGKIYAIGGATVNGAPTLATVEVYDPVTDTWDTTKTDMPTARYNMASAVVDGKIYIVGGDTIWQAGRAEGNNMVEVYDPVNDTWDTQKADMPTGRAGASGCVVNGIIYVLGGVDSTATKINVVEAFDPSTNTWTTKTPMPMNTWALGTVVRDGKIYAMGSGAAGRRVEEYDPAKDTWTSKASMLVGNGYFGTGVINGIIYTVGGAPDPFSPSSRVFAYDPSIDEWSEKTAMSTARWGLGASVVNEKIYAIGGTSDYPLSPLSINEEYTPAVTSVENKTISSPTSFKLYQNYPNPFNPVTKIDYSVTKSDFIQIAIYNILSQKIQTLVNKFHLAGNYTVDFNAKHLPSGIYFYSLKAGEKIIATKKMILMR